MAKKRLNKKVALIGSAVFVFVVLGVIGVVMHLSRDPEKFIIDGDAAFAAQDYEAAEYNYRKAHGLSKTDELRVDMLFKLADVFRETERWRDVLGCWRGITRIEPGNVKARLGLMDYVYIMGDSGAGGVWQEVLSQASEFIDSVTDEVLTEKAQSWESFGGMYDRLRRNPEMKIGTYLYMVRGRANLEIAKRGAVTEPEESLEIAISDIEKVIELDPANVEAYGYLAEVVILKGEISYSRGTLSEREKAAQKAIELLQQGVDIDKGDPYARINLLRMKRSILQMQGRDSIDSLESDYLSMSEEFGSSGEVFAELGMYYSLFGTKRLESGLKAISKAVELDSNDVSYRLLLSEMLYRRYLLQGDKSDRDEALETSRTALKLPDAQGQAGPRDYANRMNRASIYIFLARCSIEEILRLEQTEQTRIERQEWLLEAESAVREITQFFGSGEDPQVIKWRGMLDLAMGNRESGIRQLYAAYEQLQSSGRSDGQLSYVLAEAVKDTVEIGAAVEFLTSALNANISYSIPEVHLDYAETILRLNAWDAVVSNIDSYEQNFGAGSRSRGIRIKAYIGANLFDEAEKALSESGLEGIDRIELEVSLAQAWVVKIQRDISQRQSSISLLGGAAAEVDQGDVALMEAELSRYTDELAGYVEKLLIAEPNAVDDELITVVGSSYMRQGRIEQAKAAFDVFYKYLPERISVLFYRGLFSESDPAMVSQERRKEIEEKIFTSVKDPVRRSFELGKFYQRYEDSVKAAEEFKKVFDSDSRTSVTGQQSESSDKDVRELERFAATYLFDMAVAEEDWQRAEKITEIARVENLDRFEGKFFAARLAVAQEQYNQALSMLDECLGEMPLFSYGYMLRSNVNGFLGNEDACMSDARRAVSLNPTDGNISKVLANALYERDQKSGANVSREQMTETRSALERALSLNSRDAGLVSFYAGYISSTEPFRALAIRQNLQKSLPSLENAVMLGTLASRIALGDSDPKRKEALFDIAGASFEQARQMAPYDQGVLYGYAQYYRARGDEQKARELLEGAQDEQLLWRHYYQSGQLGESAKVLQGLYKNNPGDVEVLKGLVLLAQNTGDNDSLKRYSQELLSVENTIENYLLQIQLFLRAGLLVEAENKLQSFKERYPSDPMAMLLESLLTMKRGQLQRALDLANQALTADDTNPAGWQLRGEINFLMANYNQAIIDLKRSQVFFDEPSVRISLAKSYIRARREDDAIIELKNVLDDPQVFSEARLLLERIYQQPNRKESLKEFYILMLNKAPEDMYWYNRAGEFAIEEGDFGTAERIYSGAWEICREKGNNNPEIFNGYLQSLLSADKFDQVFSQAGRYVDSDVAFAAFLGMAEAKLKTGDKSAAIEYCHKAVDKSGGRGIWETWTLEKMHMLLGADEVSKYCAAKLQSNPESLAANYTMYNLAAINNEYNKALDYLDRCIGIIGPDNSQAVPYAVKKADILQKAYNKTSDKNYLKKAIAEYKSLLGKMPSSMGVLNNLAFMLAENDERPGDALRYAKKAYEAGPNNPAFMDTYSYVLYKNGRHEEALELMRAALQQYEAQRISVPAEVYEHIGMVNEKLGSSTEALSAYEQALEINNTSGSKESVNRVKAAIERLLR